MANYLALIRKADFVDLFKYGSIYINRDMTRQFSCKVEELPNRKPIFDDLSYYANAFDSTFTYLFIHYEKVFGRTNYLNIADVRGVYPLDGEAKTELSLSLDSRITINNPLWPDAVLNLQKRQTIQGCKNGVSNIWRIYNLSDSMEDVRHIITDEVLDEVVVELYENRHPQGELSIWVYVMRYERHAFYPNNSIGAFMDAVNAICNFMAKREVDSAEIESTMIMRFLSVCNEQMPNMQFSDILQKLSIQTDPRIVKFLNEVKTIDTSIDFLKAASLFYIYRNRYKEDFIYEEQWETAGKKNGREFAVACYMLGCILGHEHTYDCLYEHLPLAIFKQKRSEAMPKEPVIVKPEDVESKNPETKEEIIDDVETSTNIPLAAECGTIIESKVSMRPMPKFPCKMGKPKKGGGFAKTPKPKLVNDMIKYLELERKGWKQIKEDQKLW